ncbi:MAG: hypothetical protein ABL914_12310, partial [Novosphingobium sp.]|uniref:hypothetical protein n=1 Tax=Novosphingobium sp. TaxID=1874826 RepID=UPI0032BE1485
GHSEQTLKATFKVLPIEDLDNDPELDASANQVKSLQQILVKLDDLVNDAGEPVEYNDLLRDQLIGVPYVRIALMQHYIHAMTKVRLGN